MQFSLKLFLLCCTLAALLIAWKRIRSLPESYEQGIQYQHHSFSGRPDTIGGSITFNAKDGRALFATILSPSELKFLLSKGDASTEIESLVIVGPNTWAAVDLRDFPNVKRLSLICLLLNESTLIKLQHSNSIEVLTLSWFRSDSLSALDGVRRARTLQRLEINLDDELDLVNFPTLDQIRFLTLDCAGVAQSNLDQLRLRMPNCEVVVSDVTDGQLIHDCDYETEPSDAPKDRASRFDNGNHNAGPR